MKFTELKIKVILYFGFFRLQPNFNGVQVKKLACFKIVENMLRHLALHQCVSDDASFFYVFNCSRTKFEAVIVNLFFLQNFA